MTDSPGPVPTRGSPLTLWHLLSLDAPTVAVTWTLFVAWYAGVRLSILDPLAMFLAIWVLYAADRLLDARPLAPGLPAFDLEERHRFHHRHRVAFLRCLVAATVPLAVLLHFLAAPVLHLYTLLAALLAGWLLVVHTQPAPSSDTRRLPKELAVGVFFPAAVFIPTVARAPSMRLALLPGAVLFAAICSLNCLFLYAWEHPFDRSRAHATTRWALRRLPAAVTVLVVCCSLLAALSARAHAAAGEHRLAHPAVLPLCCAVSSTLLLLLDRLRRQVHPVRLRALADLVLLTPLLLLLYAGWQCLR